MSMKSFRAILFLAENPIQDHALHLVVLCGTVSWLLSFLALKFFKSTSQLFGRVHAPKTGIPFKWYCPVHHIRRHPIMVCPIWVMPTLIICLRQCPLDFFTEKLQFSLSSIDHLWRHTLRLCEYPVPNQTSTHQF